MTEQPTNTDEIRFRKIKTGEWVLSGPAAVIEAAVASGEKLAVTRKSGPARHIAPLRHGKRFTEDGIEKCYGYTSVVPTCSSCNEKLPKAARFCPSCGVGVSSSGAPNDFRGEGGISEAGGIPDTWALVAEKVAVLSGEAVR